MDSLHAYILLLHAKTQRDGFPVQFAIKRDKSMTPKLAAIKQQLGLLQSDVDKESEKVLNQIEAARARTQNVFAGTRDKVAKAMQGVQDQVDEVNTFLDGLEQTNGGPTLDGSQESSGNTAAPGEPAASWSGSKPA